MIDVYGILVILSLVLLAVAANARDVSALIMFFHGRYRARMRPEPPLPPTGGNDEALKKLREEGTKTTSRVDQVRTDLDGVSSQVKGLQTDVQTRFDQVRTDLDGVSSQVKGLQTDVQKRFETLTERFDDSSKELRTELGATTSALTEEREWFKRMQRLVEPRSAQQLILAGAGMSTTSPKRWSMLEKQWTLLRGNPELRVRLLELWRAEPIQRIAAHYRRLIPISARQYAEERLAAGGMPPRLEYWYRLHRTARRNFVGVYNFFTRLSRMDEP